MEPGKRSGHSIARFLYCFARPAEEPEHEREILLDVAGQHRPATLYVPARHDPRPAWVLLQGLTVPGRFHAGVRRMARALAAAGHVALVPEVPTWTALRIQPRETEPVMRAALARLDTLPEADRNRIGLMGFSVAATWALEVAAAELRGDVRAIVGMGAYADIRRTVRTMVTGEHDWKGRRYGFTPDPYGRWILGADLLPKLEGDAYGPRAAREAAAQALHQLVETSGRNGAMAWEPVYDPLIAELRSGIPNGALAAWDLLAPSSDRLVPDLSAGRKLADALAEAALRASPELDPAGRLGELRAEVILLHGRLDRLIPYTETLRLATLLPRHVRRTVTITRLVGHAKASEAKRPRNPLLLAREAWRFTHSVQRMLSALGPD